MDTKDWKEKGAVWLEEKAPMLFKLLPPNKKLTFSDGVYHWVTNERPPKDET